MPSNKQLQRTVRDEVPSYMGQAPPLTWALCSGEQMSKLERAILSLAVAAPLAVVTIGTRFHGLFGWLMLIAFLSNATAVFIVFRDLYRRQFEDPNAKLKWALWMFLTGGLAMVVYVFKHGLHPRTGARHA